MVDSSFPYSRFLRVRNTFFLILIRILFSLTFIGFTHYSHRKLQENLAQASGLNTLLSREYRSIIESDENVRVQAVQFLHDRVQGQLMMASLKLREIGRATSENVQLDINKIASDLEKIRSTDIKLVSRLLSPNIDVEGLHGVIQSLCEQFSVHTDFTINFDENVVILEETMNMGVYRLIEQAVVNSITHGPAKHVNINVESLSPDQIMIEVADDGPGSENAQIGMGTIVTDAWLSKLHGHKEISSQPGAGYTVKFIIPVKGTTDTRGQ
jgi:signal transduction histidine kinase